MWLVTLELRNVSKNLRVYNMELKDAIDEGIKSSWLLKIFYGMVIAAIIGAGLIIAGLF